MKNYLYRLLAGQTLMILFKFSVMEDVSKTITISIIIMSVVKYICGITKILKNLKAD